MTGFELGRLGEKYILDLLRQAGLDAQPCDRGADIVIRDSGLLVEVKSARLSRRARCRGRRYQFSLYRVQNGQVKTDARRADLTVLLCYNGKPTPTALFAIPRGRLGNRRHLAIPGNLAGYVGQWSWFRDWGRAIKEISGGLEL